MPARIRRMVGYSWHCAECGDYGSDWVSVEHHRTAVQSKREDAFREAQEHNEQRHAARAGTPGGDDAEAAP